MMMILGMFVFTLNNATYQSLSQKTSWRHPSNSRVGTLPAYQFIGRGENTITLTGSIMPGFKGSPKSLTKLSTMADKGKAYPLIGGNGKVWGQYVIEDIDETHTVFFKDGTPRKIEFKLELRQITTPKVLRDNLIKSATSAALDTANAMGWMDNKLGGAINDAFGRGGDEGGV